MMCEWNGEQIGTEGPGVIFGLNLLFKSKVWSDLQDQIERLLSLEKLMQISTQTSRNWVQELSLICCIKSPSVHINRTLSSNDNRLSK